MSNLKNLRHSTYFFASLIGSLIFIPFGSYMYIHPQYDCNSPSFSWWTADDVKTNNGVIHIPSCKETMAGWFIYSELIIVLGILFPLFGVVSAYTSGELDFRPLTKAEIDDHNNQYFSPIGFNNITNERSPE